MFTPQILDFSLEKTRKELNECFNMVNTQHSLVNYHILLECSQRMDEHIERVMKLKASAPEPVAFAPSYRPRQSEAQ